MQHDAAFSCACGAVTGVLHEAVPRQVCHLVCYCRDCRAFARYMGVSDRLEPGGGSPLVQVLPARIEINAGAAHIACLRLSARGLHRWYAACCNTPLANTVATSRVPFAGMWRPLFPDPGVFGPVRTRGFTRMAVPGRGAPARDAGLVTMLAGLLRRSAAAYAAGTARDSPFFGSGGAPVATPKVLTASERAAIAQD